MGSRGEPAHLMVAADSELRRLDPYKRLSAEAGPHVTGAALPTDRIQSVDVYYSEETPVIFWTNDERHTVTRYTPPVHSRAKRQTTETVLRDLVRPLGLAVDWISRHLYVVDAGAPRILLASFDGRQVATVVKSGLQEPCDVAVEPAIRRFYWSDRGVNAAIETAALDGSDRRRLVSSRLRWPCGVTVDHAAGRLYWSDPKLATVETVRLDGSDRAIVRQFDKHEGRPYMLDVFEDLLYFTTFPLPGVGRINKFGQGNVTRLAEGIRAASDLVIIQASKQSRNADDDAVSNEVTPGRLPGAPAPGAPPPVPGALPGPVTGVPGVEQREEETNDVTSPCVAGSCGPNELCVAASNKRRVCVCVDGTERVQGGDGRGGAGQCVAVARQPVLPCNLQCGEHGYCQHGPRGPQCICTSPLFTGAQCERDRCAGYCANKGHCYQNLLEASQLACNCLVGWTGDRCETPVSPCADGLACLNGGTCSRPAGRDTCICPHGFTGRLCEQCEDHECHGNSTCHRDPTTAVAECQCAPGLSGPHCETGDCSAQPCAHGKCVMVDGTPTCTYDGDSAGAACHSEQLGDYCLHGGTCQTTAAGPQCSCSARFGGKRVRDRPVYVFTRLCERRLHQLPASLLCLNGGTCEDTDRHSVCRCPSGYSGAHCEVSPDSAGGGCRTGLCLHGATCEVTPAGAVCHCLTGWGGDRCERPKSCKHYCFNGGTCQLAPSAGEGKMPTCYCPAGYVGLRCATRAPGWRAGAADDHSSGSVVTGAAVAVALVLLILAIVAAVVWRKRHGKPFTHTRMRSDKLEVDNPMYLRDLEAREAADDADEEVEDAVFSLEEKPTNFSNPVYESTYPERDGAAASSEKTNLLPAENGRPSLTFSGAAPTDPLHDTDA
ncbi:Low-density lipoprotein receptor-related protein 1 [Amphibalanus amphitrite]|uniref:Low-density lipoprotein receptor-related protein 1 n=1 Tax=Amphibalanus amphitrite TaxID=1232801 RepID=A0A6A4VZ99_AMPAM|nr:Low-density lipoprotein receptor-related protein 1 [Amphibalanus amphitrite]